MPRGFSEFLVGKDYPLTSGTSSEEANLPPPPCNETLDDELTELSNVLMRMISGGGEINKNTASIPEKTGAETLTYSADQIQVNSKLKKKKNTSPGSEFMQKT